MLIAAQEREPTAGELGTFSLAYLLFEAASARPDHIAFRDGGPRADWCDRPPLELSNAVAAEAVRRLSDFFLSLRLEPGSAIGIWLPNGTEAALTILAVSDAGLTPCLIDVTRSAGDLSKAIDVADIRALVTQARLGSDRLAQKARFVAAGFLRLRFLLAFGPGVPEGVLDLDPILVAPRSTARGRNLVDPSCKVVTFSWRDRTPDFVERSGASLMAASGLYLAHAKLRPTSRLVTWLAGDDLKGLATGLLASLLTGATLECHCVFDARTFLDVAASPATTHLVLPALLEDVLTGAELPEATSVTFVHEPPLTFGLRPGARPRTVDVLSLGEIGLITSPRLNGHAFPDAFVNDEGAWSPSLLLEASLKDANAIWLRGAAAGVVDGCVLPAEQWRPSGFSAVREDGRITGVSSAGH